MVTAPQVPDWLKPVYPFSPKAVTTALGARMSYVDQGEGPVVLMLHGNPTWSFFYRNLIAELSGQFRCIAPDHVGMGLSDKPEDYDYRLETRIRDVEWLVDTLGIKALHLVVHDWGGAIGFGLATRRPDLVQRIVILNTAAFPSRDIPFRIALCRIPAFGAILVRGLNGFAGPAVWMAMNQRKLTRLERRGYLLPYDSWDHRVAVHQFVRDIPLEKDHRSRKTLEAIAARLPELSGRPKLILWGGQDFCFDDRFFSAWSGLYPSAEKVWLQDAGHYVLDDAGAEALPRIKSFLTHA